MGKEKFKRPLLTPGIRGTGASTFAGNVRVGADFTLPTESITGSTAAQTLADHGVSFVTYATSGKTNDIIIPSPPRAGAVKYVFVIKNTSSEEMNFNTPVNTFFAGTTFNTAVVAASTVFPAGTPGFVLVAQTTDTWAFLPGSTINWDLSKTTGSTAQTTT